MDLHDSETVEIYQGFVLSLISVIAMIYMYLVTGLCKFVSVALATIHNLCHLIERGQNFKNSLIDYILLINLDNATGADTFFESAR